jgi:hypothetical protein
MLRVSEWDDPCCQTLNTHVRCNIVSGEHEDVIHREVGLRCEGTSNLVTSAYISKCISDNNGERRFK